MANPNLDAAASQAGLTPKEQAQVSGLSKLLDSHRKLMSLPENQAKATFETLTPEQQKTHVGFFSGGPVGVLGNIAHYAGEGVKQTIGRAFGALNEISDFMTRAYRTGVISMDQGIDLAKAWDIANDKGDQVFSPSRIQDAKQKFGEDIMSVAMQVASGKKLADIAVSGTEAEKQIAAANVKKLDPNFQDALDAAQAAKYSPGRQLANLVLPANLEGSGFLYRGIAGITDAAYRVFMDPTLILGKAKKAYDAGDFLLYNVLGKERFTYGRNLMNTAGNAQAVDRVFSNPGTVNLFNQYGKALGKLDEARKAKNKVAGAEAYKELKTLIPEFGDQGINVLKDAGVRDAQTAANYLKNHADVKNLMSGQAARPIPLVPTMTPARWLRVQALTTGNKIINIDKAGQAIVKAIYGDEASDVVSPLLAAPERIAELERGVGRTTGKFRDATIRLTNNQISGRIDRFMRKFEKVPYFQNGFFDVMAPDAPDKMYALAGLATTRYHARIVKEAFAAGDEGQRKQLVIGILNTIGEMRYLSKSPEGKELLDNISGKGLGYQYGSTQIIDQIDELGNPVLDEFGNVVRKIYNPAEFDGQQLALHGYQLSSAMAMPSLIEMDRLAKRAGFFNKILGISHKKWAEDATTGWTFATLVGPKFPVRNASEDLMFHLANGESVQGLFKGRFVSTALRQFKEAEMGLTREQKVVGKRIAATKELNARLTDSLATAADEAEIAKITKQISDNNALLASHRDEFAKLEGKKIKFYESNLGFVNRLIGRNRVKEFQARIAEAGDNPAVIRQIMAEAILTNRVASRALNDTDKAFINQFAKYGRTQEILDSVTEGTTNAVRGGDYSIMASNDVKRYGTVRALEYNGAKWKQSGSTFTDINPASTEAGRLSWLVKLSLHANDEIDSILVKNLDNEKVAVDELVKYLKDNPGLKDRFQLYSQNIGATEYEHARRAYADVLHTFSKADGKLNKDLWNKIRTVDKNGEIKVSTSTLSVDDLPKFSQRELYPATISGPSLVPVTEGRSFAASFADKTYDYMGAVNSRFSREAMVLDSMLSIRKDMEDTGMAQRIIDQFTKGLEGEDFVKAKDKALVHITSIAEELAKDKTLAYVDNPAVRSQLAMSVRNFARFYRATEDFYRRLARTVKYNPDAIVRASLVYEGIAHSGFVETDENGDQYFFYPGLTPVYKVMNKVFKAFGVGEAFKAPMPVEFGAKLKMITPSLNPDSLFPTFSGPLAAVPIKVLGNIIPQFKDLEQYLTGSYGQDQPMISAVLPGHINRLMQALNADERNSQMASSMRKAATYLEATGHGLKPKIDPATGQEIAPTAGELAAYQDKLQASTFTVLGLRFLFGFFAPASPQVTLKSDMAKWVRQNGTVSYKQAFNEMITKYGDVNKATQEWIRLFPDEMPYTISESEPTVAANVRAISGADKWVKDNAQLLAKYPEAAAFLIPNVGKFDFNAYKLLFKSGLRANKTVTDFLRETSSAKDRQIYYAKKDEFDQQMAYTLSPSAKQALRAEWDAWSTEFKGARPYLQEELSQGSAKAIQRLKALDDMRTMLNDKSVTTAPKLRGILSEMLATYDNYVSQRDFGGPLGTSNSQGYKDMLKSNAKITLQSLAESDPNAVAAYNTLFEPLFR